MRGAFFFTRHLFFPVRFDTNTMKIPAALQIKTLALKKRLQMLALLSKKPLTVNAISERMKIPAYNTSKHLTAMLKASLLVAKKTGRETVYRLSDGFTRKGNILDLGFCTFQIDKLPK